MLKTKLARAAGASMVLFAAITISGAAQAADQCGKASWYALTSQTASGEMMNPEAMTAAHRNLPFGSKVRVVNRANGRSVVVRINDRGPFISGRIVDVSKGAARELGMVSAGVVSACIERIG